MGSKEDTNERIQKIADMLADVIEEAMRQQDSANESINRLNGAITTATSSIRKAVEVAVSTHNTTAERIKLLATAMPIDIENAISKKLNRAAEHAANTMVQKWDAANRSAEHATRIFQTSINRMATLIITVFSAGMISGTALTVWLLRSG